MPRTPANEVAADDTSTEPAKEARNGAHLSARQYTRSELFDVLVPPVKRGQEGARLADLVILGVYRRYLDSYAGTRPGWNPSERAFLIFLNDEKAAGNDLPGSMQSTWSKDSLGDAFLRIERTFRALIFERQYADGSGELLPTTSGYMREGVVNRTTERFTPAGLAIARWGMIVKSFLDLPGRMGDKFDHLALLETFQERFAEEVGALHARTEAEMAEAVRVQQQKQARRSKEHSDLLLGDDLRDRWHDVNDHPDRHEEPEIDPENSFRKRSGRRSN